MKLHLTTFFFALIAGYLGGVSSQFLRPAATAVDQTRATDNTGISSPLQIQTESSTLTLQLAQLQQKIDWLEMQLNELAQNQTNITANTAVETSASTRENIRQHRSAAPGKDNLVAAGVSPYVADDILRRISQQEFRRLELQNLIRRNTSSGARQYRNELRELNKNKVTLRSELGDEAYDQYLFVSGKSNRVKVSSVMADSPAELNGVQKDDVILYYDNQKILNSSDIRKATLEGDIGILTNVEILRDGMRMSLIVPRGTLGVRLEETQLSPAR